MKPMVLTVPAKQEWALVLRMTAAGVCALYDVPVDVMEDLRVAIEESCELLLHQDFQSETLTLQCEAREDGLHLCLSASERTCRQADAPADAEIAQMIIQPLVREIIMDKDESGVHCVHLTLPAGT